MSTLPLRARLFIAVVALVAAPLPVVAVVAGYSTFSMVDLVTLALLLVLSSSLTSRGSRDDASIALGSVAAMAALPLLGGWGTVVLACASAFVNDSPSLIKRVFNTSQVVVASAASAVVYFLLGGGGITGHSFPFLIWPFVAALAVRCLVNGLLVATVIHLAQGVSLRTVWHGTMARSVAGYVGYGLFGLLLAVLWAPAGADVGPAAAVLVLMPLFVARWAYEQYAEQQRAYDRTVRTLIAAVETKDLYTRGHSERVAVASVLIARCIGMREDRVASLRYAGMLHDVGKLGVPTRVLQKTGQLTEEEFAAIKLHPVRGLEMIREIEFLGEAFAGIMHHHERLDGLGYPMGLRGEEIPEFARAIAVADAFDSMTTTRSYRGARTAEDALVELQRCAGSQFDPVMVAALVSALEDHEWQSETRPVFEIAGHDSLEGAVPSHDSISAPDEGPVFDHDDPMSTARPTAMGTTS
ncbi:MAG: HD-GYP domain-containing protein [Sporichthyaceae bacterium]